MKIQIHNKSYFLNLALFLKYPVIAYTGIFLHLSKFIAVDFHDVTNRIRTWVTHVCFEVVLNSFVVDSCKGSLV